MPEQIMWVQPPKTLLFVEIEGFWERSGGGRKIKIFKNAWEYFSQVGAVQISIFFRDYGNNDLNVPAPYIYIYTHKQLNH